MKEMINGVRLADSTVDEAYVRRYANERVSILVDGSPFDRQDTFRKNRGVIHIRSVSPGRGGTQIIRSVSFTPIPQD